MNMRTYLSELKAAVQLMTCLLEEEHDTIASMAAACNVAPQTLQRLARGKTRFPRHLTLIKIAEASGCEIRLERRTVKLRLKTDDKRAQARTG